jgi:hypothetical protein
METDTLELALDLMCRNLERIISDDLMRLDGEMLAQGHAAEAVDREIGNLHSRGSSMLPCGNHVSAPETPS